MLNRIIAIKNWDFIKKFLPEEALEPSGFIDEFFQCFKHWTNSMQNRKLWV